MSKLDKIQPSRVIDGELYYDVELRVEGEWVFIAAMTKDHVLKVVEYASEVIES